MTCILLFGSISSSPQGLVPFAFERLGMNHSSLPAVDQYGTRCSEVGCFSDQGLGQSGSEGLEGHGSAFQGLDQLVSVFPYTQCSPPAEAWSTWPFGIYMACSVEDTSSDRLDDLKF